MTTDLCLHILYYYEFTAIVTTSIMSIIYAFVSKIDRHLCSTVNKYMINMLHTTNFISTQFINISALLISTFQLPIQILISPILCHHTVMFWFSCLQFTGSFGAISIHYCLITEFFGCIFL